MAVDETHLERSYQIGTVSTLTGIDPHTIRAWERRYNAITPARSESGRRRYDDHTVERLQLLKALVDCNESIGLIAHLPDEALRDRLAKLADLGRNRSRVDAPSDADRRVWSLALVAPGLESQLRANAIALPELEIMVSAEDREGLLDAVRKTPCEVVVLELDRIGSSPLGFVQSCRGLPGAPLVVVLYRFAPRALLARLAQAGARLVQVPIRLEQLRRQLLDLLMIEKAQVRRQRLESPVEPADAASDDRVLAAYGPPDAAAAPPARRFDDDQLARLFEVSSGIDCECPNHLSSLVAALVAFERYSKSCESRDEADAKLHRRLAYGTGQARALLESLLAQLCEQEGIKV
jgi:DNA-binding transcriptional MerR regulator